MGNIDLTNFEKAIISLHKIIERYERDNHDIDIRDAVIQRFEYTFSSAVKIIIRSLKYLKPEEINESISFNEAIRKANQSGLLLTDLEKWTDYRQKRNVTSHLYDENAVVGIIQIVPDFLEDVDFLLARLKENL